MTNLECRWLSVKYIMFAGDQLWEEMNELYPAHSVYTRSANVDSYCLQNQWPSDLIRFVPDWLDTTTNIIIIHVLTVSCSLH